MTVVNTKLCNVKANSGATQNTTFVNCNISSLYALYFSGTIINSIIYRSVNSSGNTGYEASQISSTVLLNTLYTPYVSFSTSSVKQNCYDKKSNYSSYLSSTCDCIESTSTQQSYGYLGTDGTVVGIYGGKTPYTLVPSVPKVTSSDLQLDNENKILNVKLTVSPQ
jgi:hypothetical protein